MPESPSTAHETLAALLRTIKHPDGRPYVPPEKVLTIAVALSNLGVSVASLSAAPEPPNNAELKDVFETLDSLQRIVHHKYGTSMVGWDQTRYRELTNAIKRVRVVLSASVAPRGSHE